MSKLRAPWGSMTSRYSRVLRRVAGRRACGQDHYGGRCDVFSSMCLIEPPVCNAGAADQGRRLLPQEGKARELARGQGGGGGGGG